MEGENGKVRVETRKAGTIRSNIKDGEEVAISL